MDRNGNASQDVDALAKLQHVSGSKQSLSELLATLKKADDRLLDIECGLECTWNAFKVPVRQQSTDSFPLILFELKFNGDKLLTRKAQGKRYEKMTSSFRNIVQKIDGRLYTSVFRNQGNDERSFLAFDLDKCLGLVKSSLGPQHFEEGVSNEVKSAFEDIRARLMKYQKADDVQCQGCVKMLITIILKNVFDDYKKLFRKNKAPPHLQVLHNHINNTQRAKTEKTNPKLYAYKKSIMVLLHEAGVVSPNVFAKFSGNSMTISQVQSGHVTIGPNTPSEGEILPTNGQLSTFQVQSMNDDTLCLRIDNGKPMPSNYGHSFQPLTGEEEGQIIRCDDSVFEFLQQDFFMQG